MYHIYDGLWSIRVYILYFCIFGIFHPNDQLMYGHNQATWVCTMWNQLRITYHWSGYHLQKYSWFQFSLGGQNERILRWILCEIDDWFRLKKIIFHLCGMCYSKWLVQCFWPINSILMGVFRWLLAGYIPIYNHEQRLTIAYLWGSHIGDTMTKLFIN